MYRLLQYYSTVFLKCIRTDNNFELRDAVDARYLIQYIHFSFHRFCDDESSRSFATVFSYHPAT